MKRVVLSYLVIAALTVSAAFASYSKDDANDSNFWKPQKGDVYVAGNDGSFATVWKNGVAQKFTDGTRNASAHSIFVVE